MPGLSREDAEPPLCALDPWGQPKLKLVSRVVAPTNYSQKSVSPDQMSVISETRRKSVMGRRLTGKKNSNAIRLTSSKHGSEVSRLEVEEEGSPRPNAGKKNGD